MTSGPHGPDAARDELIDRWKRARLIDYFLTLNNATSRLPVVGRYLADLGSLTALGVWGAKHAPGIASTVRSRLKERSAEDRRRERTGVARIAEAVLGEMFAAEDVTVAWPAARRLPPVLHAFSQRRSVYAEAVAYGSHPDQVLDVWRPQNLDDGPAPVMIFVPGGAWVFGKRVIQGHSLMSELTEQGWICLSVQYRAAPSHKWPDCFQDIKTAIAWARENASRYGGDTDFIALAGCSAGGHLASLAALTANDPHYQKHLPADADTSVDAVASLYGRYDWQDSDVRERAEFIDFLERVVVQRRYSYAADTFTDASPINHVHPECPPFLIVHGSDDSIIPVDEARQFSAELSATSRQVVAYLELPGAEHAFDLIDGARTGPVNAAIAAFLEVANRRRKTPRRSAATAQ